MRLLFVFLVLFLPLEAQKSARPRAVKDYKVLVPQFLLEEVNDPWSRLKKPVEVKEVDIYHRLRGERTSSFHGRVTVRCGNAYDRSINLLFSLRPEAPPSMKLKLFEQGLRPAPSMDRVVAVLVADEKAQQDVATYVLSLILGVCKEDRKSTESNIALALWIGLDGVNLRFTSSPITRQRFNQIK